MRPSPRTRDASKIIWCILGSIACVALACLSWCAPPARADSMQVALGGQTLGIVEMDSGPPTAAELAQASGGLGVLSQTAKMLDGVPTSSWNYGCSATSAGMIFGYYDRHGYDNMWAGGVVPMYMGDMNAGTACSLIATPQHVADYWSSYLSTGPDPWQVQGRSDHTWADCVADFMGTNQWKWDFDGNGTVDSNVDGATSLFAYDSGAKLYDYVPPAGDGLPQTELTHGMRLFAESRGYTVLEDYTQRIDARYSGGFSFADYEREIDDGYPVMIQVTGHSMVGVGYDAPTQTVYLHDTWGDYTASMPWGGAYEGRQELAATVIHLAPLENGDPSTPELPPGALALIGLAPAMCGRLRRRTPRS